MFIYREACRIIREAREKKSSVKALVLASKCKNVKQLYAIVCETIKYTSVLDHIITASQLCKSDRLLKDKDLTRVLLYDFLIGKGIKGAAQKYKDVFLKHKTSIRAELERMKVKAKVTDLEGLLPSQSQVQLPRFVRVNSLKTSVQTVIQQFKNEGYTYMEKKHASYGRFIDDVKHLKPREFMTDFHLPGLLVFASGTDLHAHPLYETGAIILQDKASCLPAFVLNPPPGSHVIDCCAAPGNKTTHLASIMENTGTLHAFDKDPKRFSLLSKMVKKAGVTCATLRNEDFLAVDHTDPCYRDVEYILVDPSCSGSGIISRMDAFIDKDRSNNTQERLENLSKFQCEILQHALSFPTVKRVVYSTCSVHQQENEDVAKHVLSRYHGNFVFSKILPTWLQRGASNCKDKGMFLRASPENDLTNGFFVACFERSQATNNNTYASQKKQLEIHLDMNSSDNCEENSKKKCVTNQGSKLMTGVCPLGKTNNADQNYQNNSSNQQISENKTQTGCHDHPSKSNKKRKKRSKNSEETVTPTKVLCTDSKMVDGNAEKMVTIDHGPTLLKYIPKLKKKQKRHKSKKPIQI